MQRGVNPNIAPQHSATEIGILSRDAHAASGRAFVLWEAEYGRELARIEAANAYIRGQNEIGAATHAWTQRYNRYTTAGEWFTWANYDPRTPLPPFQPQALWVEPTQAQWEAGFTWHRVGEVNPGGGVPHLRPAHVDPPNPLMSPSVKILTITISLIEVGVVPCFGVPFGFGDSPDWGSQLSSSMSKCAEAYDQLTSATPKITDWYSAASQEYTVDVQGLQFVAAQAGIDAVLTTFVTQSQSLDTQLQQWISTQALGVELLQVVLAALIAGLVFFEGVALATEAFFGLGTSLGLQRAVATSAVMAVVGILLTMGIWSHTIQGHIDNVASAYDDLATQIPSSVPSVSPYGGSLAQASTTPWFVDVNLSASTDEPTHTTAAASSGRHHARPPTLTDIGAPPSPSAPFRPESDAAADPASPPLEASPSPREPLITAARTTPRHSKPSQDPASTPQRPPTTWADSRTSTVTPTKAVHSEEVDTTAAAAGMPVAERVPVGVAASSPDQAAPVKPSEERRITSPPEHNHDQEV